MSVDLPSQQACVRIAGDSAGIQGSGREREGEQRCRYERDIGIWDEESKCAILVLAILAAIFCKEMYTHFDPLLKNLQRRDSEKIHDPLQTQDLQPLKEVCLHKLIDVWYQSGPLSSILEVASKPLTRVGDNLRDRRSLLVALVRWPTLKITRFCMISKQMVVSEW